MGAPTRQTNGNFLGETDESPQSKRRSPGREKGGDHTTVTVITGVQRSGLGTVCGFQVTITSISLMVAVDLSCVLVNSTIKRRNVWEGNCFKKGGKKGGEFSFLRTCRR